MNQMLDIDHFQFTLCFTQFVHRTVPINQDLTNRTVPINQDLAHRTVPVKLSVQT